MGEFLSQPIKEKQSEDGENSSVYFLLILQIRFGASGMQGWRKRMEDSHISDLDVSKGNHIFGVFDGHGGREVAVWIKKHFTKKISDVNVIFEI